MRSVRAAAICAVYFMSVMNIAFWRYVWRHIELSDARSYVFALSLPLAFFLAFFAAFSLILWPWAGKPILGLLLVLSAAANYFMVNLNVHIDSEMIRNLFETNPGEAAEMITLSGALWVAGLGLAPALALWKTKIVYGSPWREAARRTAGILLALALFAGIGALLYKDYSSSARNNKVIGKLLNPANYVSSFISYVNKIRRANQEFAVIDDDPNHVPYEDPYYTVLILMIGETARAKNFSLNGYERETNPKLARQDIVNFPNVSASGTATAFSLPCMFSHLPRSKFNIDDSYQSENLLDVMAKAGYDVLWLDNDGGSKGVAQRVPYVDLMRDGKPPHRNGDTCFDEVLLDGLEEKLAGIRQDTVIVLHMMGSHGPSYYKRYPEAFRKFTPTCDSAEIHNFPTEEIVNTYDNTILYTDHVVSETIDILKRFPKHEAGLIFVSDHGESLGENGLFLHGFPYAFAPQEQIRVPMLLWMSETMKREDHIDYEKLGKAAGGLELSHDNLFHSVLGLVEIDTELYDPSLDFFREFRTKSLPYQ
ncbi:MAG: phosphoethanolamine--lipid A transferase [Planctomycetota bacterium]|nr:phosphoethanolamine--lipid A transferase [Planctomycetota bacterium]